MRGPQRKYLEDALARQTGGLLKTGGEGYKPIIIDLLGQRTGARPRPSICLDSALVRPRRQGISQVCEEFIKQSNNASGILLQWRSAFCSEIVAISKFLPTMDGAV